ncbi:MAG TPA: hypothetical protein VMZ69_06235, partial [Saprospiraceae bacterium]|nr:hypothetical protein [Saprospiraceae bacterium]
MKSILITLSIIISFISTSSSQFRFDIVGGVSPGAAPNSAGLLVNRQSPHEEFVFNLAKVNPQFFAGVKGQLQLASPFFMDAGLTYTMRKSTFDVVYTIIDREHPVSQHVMSETNHMMLLPVNVGVNMGIFDVTSGLRLIKSISKNSNLTELSGFQSDGDPIRIGWQAGVGIDVFRSRAGIEYHGNFSRVGS